MEFTATISRQDLNLRPPGQRALWANLELRETLAVMIPTTLTDPLGRVANLKQRGEAEACKSHWLTS